MSTVAPLYTTLDHAVARARQLAGGERRAILGIAGPPGAGKSTLADALQQHVGASAVVVGMDGFHLAQAELERLGRAARKGAPDTFDSLGYAALLRRLRTDAGTVVYAPGFRRDLEEPIAGAVAVPPSVRLVITEGNYLLLDEDGWPAARREIDEIWYLDPDDDLRVSRLIARHQRFGKDEAAARAWALEIDGANARLVQAARGRADAVVRLPGAAPVAGGS